MKTFLGIVVALVLIVAVGVALGWVFFFNDEGRVGIGVNVDESAAETRAIGESIGDATREVGASVEGVSGRNAASTEGSTIVVED